MRFQRSDPKPTNPNPRASPSTAVSMPPKRRASRPQKGNRSSAQFCTRRFARTQRRFLSRHLYGARARCRSPARVNLASFSLRVLQRLRFRYGARANSIRNNPAATTRASSCHPLTRRSHDSSPCSRTSNFCRESSGKPRRGSKPSIDCEAVVTAQGGGNYEALHALWPKKCELLPISRA